MRHLYLVTESNMGSIQELTNNHFHYERRFSTKGLIAKVLVFLATCLMYQNVQAFSQDEVIQDDGITCLSIEEGVELYSHHKVKASSDSIPLPPELVLHNLKMNGDLIVDSEEIASRDWTYFESPAGKQDKVIWDTIGKGRLLEHNSTDDHKYVAGCKIYFDRPYEGVRPGSPTFFKDKVLGNPTFSKNTKMSFPFRDNRGNAGTLDCYADIRFLYKGNGKNLNHIYESSAKNKADYYVNDEVGVPIIFLLHALLKTGAISGQLCPAQKIYGEEQDIYNPNTNAVL